MINEAGSGTLLLETTAIPRGPLSPEMTVVTSVPSRLALSITPAAVTVQ